MDDVRSMLRVRDLFVPENVVLFVISSLALGIAGNAAYDFFYDLVFDRTESRGGTLTAILIGSLLIGIVIVGVLANAIRRFLEARARSRLVVNPVGRVDRHRVAIVFVSGGRGTSHERVIDFHIGDHPTSPTLERCWLLHSASSRDKAIEFMQNREAKTGRRVRFHLDQWMLADADVNDMEAAFAMFRNAIDAVLAEPASPAYTIADIVVDVTGGTAMITVGALLACLERGVDPEYVRQGVEPGEPDLAIIDARWMTGVQSSPGITPAS